MADEIKQSDAVKPNEPHLNELPKIRTFKTDAEYFMHEKRVSQLDVDRGAYIAGKKSAELAPSSEISYKKMFFVLLVIVIVAAGGFLAYKFYFQNSSAVEQQPEAAKPTTNFAPIDDQKDVALSQASPGNFINVLLVERAKPLRFDTIIYFPVQITKNTGEIKYADSKDFVNALSWNPPKDFIDNLAPEFNTLIVYGQNSNDIATIFKVNNFPSAVASMLAWEKTIWLDWKPLLIDISSSSTPQFTFQDDVVQNNDARLLKDSQGKTILGYSIFNRQLVIISTSRESLSVILSRLIALPPR